MFNYSEFGVGFFCLAFFHVWSMFSLDLMLLSFELLFLLICSKMNLAGRELTYMTMSLRIRQEDETLKVESLVPSLALLPLHPLQITCLQRQTRLVIIKRVYYH